ncbi:MAG: hypothetical protein ACRDLF_13980, partial [Solirubrobacteraceae bacterium]
LTGCAIAVAGAAGGARRLRATVALAGTVWLYDLKAKDTPAGPWTMALARALDVLMGAGRNGDRFGRHSLRSHPRIGQRRRRVSPGFGRRPHQAGPAAAVVGAHTLLITLVSAREVEGADTALAGRALLGVAATVTAAATLIFADPLSADATALALACLALYGCAMGRAGGGALRRPDPVRLQRMVATGVLANMPLQAALLAGRGRRASAAALMVGWPAARWAGRKGAVT